MQGFKRFIHFVALFAIAMAVVLLFASCGQKYTITYTDNDGNIFSVTVTEKSNNKLPPLEYVPGYKADGYRLYIGEGKYGKCYFDSDGNQMEGVEIDGDLTLCQEYLPAKIDVVFDAGDGLLENGENQLILEIDYTGSLSYGSKKMPQAPVANNEHFVFDKWVDANGEIFDGETVLDSSRPVDLDNNTMTVYACYKPREYVVTVDYDRSHMGIFRYKLLYGEGLDSIPFADDGAGYEIIGWTLTKGSDDIYSGTVYGDMTIYPVWRKYIAVELVHTVDKRERLKVYPDEVTSAVLPIPERNGYAFVGWFSSPDAMTPVSSPVDIDALLTTYYARWELEVYTLKFKTGTEEAIQDADYSIGSIDELPTPQRRGYDFVGWRTDGYSQPFFNIPADMYGDRTLEAVWDAKEYGVSFDANGGELSGTQSKVEYSSAYTLPVPTRVGHRFVGWYLVTDGGAVRITDENGRSLDFWTWTTDIAVYAEYELRSYTVKYDAGNGTGIIKQTYTYGDAISFPEPPSRDGYYFGGWFDQTFTAEYSPANYVASDMTLYARWVASIPISNAEELKAIAGNTSARYHLTCDINLGGDSWVPIENFSGTLDGRGFAIHNGDISAIANGSAGIFTTNSGTVKNLTVKDFIINFAQTVEGNSQTTFTVGVIAGINQGTILNCRVTDTNIVATLNLHPNRKEATATATLKLGGIAGSSTGRIDGCLSSTQISAYLNHYYVKDFNNGNATGKGYLYIGGIAGENGGRIRASVCNGDIISHTDCTGQSAGANIYNYNYAGGITAYNGGTVESCFTSGNLNAKSTDSCGQTTWQSDTYSYVYAGGIAAINARIIEASGAEGLVKTDCQLGGRDVNGNYVKLSYVGGLVAEAVSGSEISNSFSTANIIQNSGNDRIAGAFIAANNGKIQNCYADGDMVIEGGYSSCFVGLNREAGTISGSIAYGDVLLYSAGLYGPFVAENRGAIRSCVYSDGVQYKLGESFLTLPSAGGVSCVSYEELANGKYQAATLLWHSEYWTLTADGIKLAAVAAVEHIK